MKLICIGDSFTRGFGVKKNENWISQISLENTDIINKGIDGDTTSGMLARFNGDVISQTPNYVLITGGMNDFISGSNCEIPQNNYMAMVHQAFHNGIIPIVGIDPGFQPSSVRQDWSMFSNFDLVLKKHQQLRTWLKQMCHTFGVFYIDFDKLFSEATSNLPKNNYYLDGLHFTAEGHKIIGSIAESFLANILKS